MLTLSEAAEQLGISRAALDNWIKRLEIEKKKRRTDWAHCQGG